MLEELKPIFYLDPDQKAALVRIYDTYRTEAEKCFSAGAMLAAATYMGAMFETRLLFTIASHVDNLSTAPAFTRFPRKKHLLSWQLKDLIRLGEGFGWFHEFFIESYPGIVASPSDWAFQVREARNFIHPGKLVREGLENELSEEAVRHLNDLLRRLESLLSLGRYPGIEGVPAFAKLMQLKKQANEKNGSTQNA